MSELARVDVGDLDGAKLVRVSGEIDLSNVREVRDAISRAVPTEAHLVVLDLTETAYLDSAGIAMIFRLAERLGVRRQELQLVVPDDAPIRAVLRLTSLDRVIPVLDSIGGS